MSHRLKRVHSSLLRIAIDEYQPAGNESAHAAFDIVLDHFASAQRIINGMVYDASQAADVLWIYRHGKPDSRSIH